MCTVVKTFFTYPNRKERKSVSCVMSSDVAETSAACLVYAGLVHSTACSCDVPGNTPADCQFELSIRYWYYDSLQH